MAFSSFCGLLTLQVGSAILATVFVVIGMLVFGVTIFDYQENTENGWPINLMLICIFVVLMIFAGVLIFMSAYNESRTFCLAAIGVIFVITVYWSALTIFGLVNNPTDVRRVCVEHRCGASFWLANLNYRAVYRSWEEHSPQTQSKGIQTDITTTKPTADTLNTTDAATPTMAPKIIKKRDTPIDTVNDAINPSDKANPKSSERKNSRLDSQAYLHEDEKTVSDSKKTPYKKWSYLMKKLGSDMLRDQKKEPFLISLSRMDRKDYEGGYDDDYYDKELKDNNDQKSKNETASPESNNAFVLSTAFTGAIIFSIVNFVFLIFSMMIVWSYAQELKLDAYFHNLNTQPQR